MRLLIMMLVFGSLMGCAHATVHEICSDPETSAHYRDYDQCYAEQAAKAERRMAAKQAWVNGWYNLGHNNNVTCTTVSGVTSCH